MKVKMYGTRGSIPVSNRECVKYGGNTTCVHVISDCIPPNESLVIDTGSGFVPLGHNGLKNGIKRYNILYSHYHHDHTQGLLLAPPTFIEGINLDIYGPEDLSVGPRQVVEALMNPPYFPVHFKQVGSRFSFKNLQFVESRVLLVHPEGGFKVLTLEDFQNITKRGDQIPFGRQRYDLNECLLIRMIGTNHPQMTISYRFEELPTGRTFVFLTDHEDVAGISMAFKKHLKGADLLVADAQYSRDKYIASTAGYGHGTSFGCVRLAVLCGCTRLGLTHHDPTATDAYIDNVILNEAVEAREQLKREVDECLLEDIFCCYDYQELDV
jgi:phosphoribosyl 1,2-cyclic phosphodiesterase